MFAKIHESLYIFHVFPTVEHRNQLESIRDTPNVYNKAVSNVFLFSVNSQCFVSWVAGTHGVSPGLFTWKKKANTLGLNFPMDVIFSVAKKDLRETEWKCDTKHQKLIISAKIVNSLVCSISKHVVVEIFSVERNFIILLPTSKSSLLNALDILVKLTIFSGWSSFVIVLFRTDVFMFEIIVDFTFVFYLSILLSLSLLSLSCCSFTLGMFLNILNTCISNTFLIFSMLSFIHNGMNWDSAYISWLDGTSMLSGAMFF